MRFDPYIEAPLHEQYPEIALRDIFIQQDKLLRAAVLYVAPDSPFASIRDFNIRLDKVVASLGEHEALKLSKQQRDEIASYSGDWPKIVYELFRLINDIDYEAWWSTRCSFHVLTHRMRDPGTMKDGDRLKISKEIDAIRKRLKEMEYDLFQDDYLKDQITKQSVAESLTGYAEQLALNSP